MMMFRLDDFDLFIDRLLYFVLFPRIPLPPIEHILDKNEDTTSKIIVVPLRDKIIAVARYLRKPQVHNAENMTSSIKPL